MTKHILSAMTLTVSVAAFGAGKSSAKIAVPPPEVSVRDQALTENSSIDQKAYKKTIQASEAQQANVSSFLKLQDPAMELRDRAWFWTFAFKLQSFKPAGTGTAANMSYDLANFGNTVMPSIELGFLMDTPAKNSVTWKTGLSARAGYIAQNTTLVTQTGYQYKDTRLNTTVTSAVWNNRISVPKYSKWNALVNPEFGSISYTQTGTETSLANFSQQNNYWGLGLGMEYSVSPKWGVLGQYAYRAASSGDAKKTDIQKDNVEIGTVVTW